MLSRLFLPSFSPVMLLFPFLFLLFLFFLPFSSPTLPLFLPSLAWPFSSLLQSCLVTFSHSLSCFGIFLFSSLYFPHFSVYFVKLFLPFLLFSFPFTFLLLIFLFLFSFLFCLSSASYFSSLLPFLYLPSFYHSTSSLNLLSSFLSSELNILFASLPFSLSFIFCLLFSSFPSFSLPSFLPASFYHSTSSLN